MITTKFKETISTFDFSNIFQKKLKIPYENDS